MNQQINQDEINAILWRACDTFRGTVDPSEYKNYILVMLFVKYISDVWQDHYDQLKQEFGDRITFWGGGCDTQNILPKGTPEQIQTHVGEQVSDLEKNGGFVFQQVHNIQADVPPENIVAMFEAVRKFNH